MFAIVLCTIRPMQRGGIYALDSLRGVYVLAVDGTAEGREVLNGVLRHCGSYVRTAPTALAALELMRQMLPDVLVVDLDIEDDEFSLLRRVRALKPDAGGMVRAVGIGLPGREAAARAKGYDGFVRRPIDPWELCRLVSSLTSL